MRGLTSRLLALTVPVVLLATACSGGAPAAPASTPDRFAPTGAPVRLEPVEDADGEPVELADGLSIVVPEGSTSEPVTSQVEGAERVLYRMPDADADGIPSMQVSWQVEGQVGALESTWAQETTMRTNPISSDFERSAAQWPGARTAVVSTWTEEVATDGEPVVVDALSLTVDTEDGASVVAVAVAPSGELDDSSSLDALRTLTLG